MTKVKFPNKHVQIYLGAISACVLAMIIYQVETFGNDPALQRWLLFAGFSFVIYLFGGTYLLVTMKYCVNVALQIVIVLLLATVCVMSTILAYKIGMTTSWSQVITWCQCLVQIGFTLYHFYSCFWYVQIMYDVSLYMTSGDGKKYLDRCASCC